VSFSRWRTRRGPFERERLGAYDDAWDLREHRQQPASTGDALPEFLQRRLL
jgi:hypothetical protein